LIPAYNPDLRLVDLVQELQRSGRLAEIIVVDDGSGQRCRAIFARLAAMPRVTVLHHAGNLGKGAALKTGLNHVCFAMPHGSGAVTADADGQHLSADVLRVAERLGETGDRLVLGSRQFAGTVPLRSRLGNVLTKYAFWGVMGKKLEDTQSGLRGIPQALARQLLLLKDSGYEFELDMLVHCRRTGVPIEACPIATVYLDENRSSHFHPLFDSLKIYNVFLRFIAASLATAAVDYLVFLLAIAGMANILLAQVAARLAAVGVNFVLARQAVFRSRADWGWSLAKFVLLVAVMGATSYGLIRTAMHAFGWSVLPAKIASELALYMANFIIQRDFIFRNTAAAGRSRMDSALQQMGEATVPPAASRRAA
jgi:glycosyltransferase involved in cell wall biosynthesis